MNSRNLKEAVRKKYGQAAKQATSGRRACCGQRAGNPDPVTINLYSPAERNELPQEAVLASLGCGNPTALANLNAGEIVLDLGSGGGIDVLLSARRVGPRGNADGLDMTDEMLELARQNQLRAGITNAEFLKGEIENIPLPDSAVDVVISNCVINLSADKGAVLREVFRVLTPGGRFAVSDILVRGDIPDHIRRNVELWAGCVAGALHESEYRPLLAAAGFEAIGIETTRVYGCEEGRQFLAGHVLDADSLASKIDGKFISAFVQARKPMARRHPESDGQKAIAA